MAIAFRSSSTADLASPGATTTITLPAGVASTDVVVAVFGSIRTAITSPNDITPPAGWTIIAATISANDGSSEVSLHAFWALGSVAALGFTNTQTTGLSQDWVCAAFTGVDTTTPIDVAGTAVSGGASVTCGSITIATANAWELIAATDVHKHALTSSGFSSASSAGTNALAALFYNTTPNATGATGTQNVAIGVSDPAEKTLGLPFALRLYVPPDPYMVLYASGYQQPASTYSPALNNPMSTDGVAMSGTGSSAVTVVIDYGKTVTINEFAGMVGFANTPTDAWQYSNDGITWTPFTTTLGSAYTPGGGTYSTVFQTWTPSGSTVTGRYFQYSIQDAGTVGQAGVHTLAGSPGTAGTGGGALSVGSTGVWNGGFVSVSFDHQTVQTAVGAIWQGSGQDPGNVYNSYDGGVQYVSGGTLNAATEPYGTNGTNGVYKLATLWDDYTYGNHTFYVGYFCQNADIYAGVDVVYFAKGALHTYTGWRNAGTVGTVPANAIGSTWKLTGHKAITTYANKRTVGSNTLIDVTITTEYWIGFVTWGAYVITSILSGTTGSIVPQGWGDWSQPVLTPAYPHNVGINAAQQDLLRSSWWQIYPGPYDDLHTKGFSNTAARHDAWGVSAISLSNMTIAVPCDEGGTPGFFNLYAVGASLTNFDSNTSDVSGDLDYTGARGTPYIWPDSFGNVGVFGCFLVNSGGTACGTTAATDTAADRVTFSATSFDGALNVAWVSGGWPGALKTAVHLSPQKQIGSSTTAWNATQTIEASGVRACGLLYLPNGRIYLNYNLTNAARYRTSDSFGLSGWSAITVAEQDHVSAAGLGQEQSFRLIAGGDSASGIGWTQCRDNQAKSFTDTININATARGPLCGGAWLGNQYAVLYTRFSDSHVFCTTSPSGSAWASPGTDTGFTGRACGMCRHPSGRIVGLLQPTAGGSASVIYSDDNGLTWTAGGSLGISPSPPPQIVCVWDCLYVVYISSDAPHFVASSDCGVTWT
jgi:hypothetical protein